MKNRFYDLRKRQSYGVIIAICVAVIIAICIFCTFESILIIGDSMLPNFVGGVADNNGNIIKKGDKVIISKLYNLQYGDVVVFYNEALKENLIKRVIGLEGDEIEIKDNVLYRNGKAVEENYIKEPMINNINQKWQVAKDCVFVLGDNRNNSRDSRELGAISTQDIKGEVILRVSVTNGKITFI